MGSCLKQGPRRARQLQREVSGSIWDHRGCERGREERGLGKGAVGNDREDFEGIQMAVESMDPGPQVDELIGDQDE